MFGRAEPFIQFLVEGNMGSVHVKFEPVVQMPFKQQACQVASNKLGVFHFNVCFISRLRSFYMKHLANVPIMFSKDNTIML